MNFAFSEEQEFLRQTAREWLEKKSPSAKVRELMETAEGFDRGQWEELAGLGWHAMAIPEEYGGAGYGFLEVAVLLEEMGRALLPAPFLSTVVLAANAILLAGSEDQKAALLPGIAAGETIATVAVGEESGLWEPEAIATVASSDGAGWSISGVKKYVLDGHTADVIVVAARAGDEVGLFVVREGAAGLSAEPLPTMDPTRKLADVTLDGVAAERLGGDASATIEKLLQVASVALAVEGVGGAQKVLEASVQYAKDRVQFGRPIGSFQAIKHKCADMLVAVESSKSAAYYGAWSVAEDNSELPIVAPLAKSYCTEAYFQCAAENIQVHGGIGFTWEHDAHLYFKRAKSNELMFGDPAHHRALLADRLGL